MIFHRALSPAESKEVFPSVRKLITADRFHARGIELNRNNELEQWHIEVDRSAEQWFAVNEHGHIHGYRDGQTFRRGQPVEHHTTMESGRGLVPPFAWAEPIAPRHARATCRTHCDVQLVPKLLRTIFSDLGRHDPAEACVPPHMLLRVLRQLPHSIHWRVDRRFHVEGTILTHASTLPCAR